MVSFDGYFGELERRLSSMSTIWTLRLASVKACRCFSFCLLSFFIEIFSEGFAGSEGFCMAWCGGFCDRMRKRTLNKEVKSFLRIIERTTDAFD